MDRRMRTQGGFTLTELIIVIVITGTLAVISVQFVSLSTRGAIDTAARQRLAQTGNVINTQVSRALRNALPNSVRELDGGRCIEWIPVLAASVYETVPIATAANSFPAVAYSDSETITGRVAVYPLADNPYDLTEPAVISPAATLPSGTGGVTVSLGSDHRFPTDSPNRRFFMVGDPRTICQDGQFLYLYSGYGFQDSPGDTLAALPANLAGGREVLGAPLEAGSGQFDFTGPTLTRNGVVRFRYRLIDFESGDSLALSQEVQIRNVP